jgi:diaminohydroxyphosphoribosylaminopyrimidine deaminase/5-amino-6-(5-phosphoribosylamino)uracil reductase
MRHALVLARRGLGRVAPNPAVGCVIVSAESHVVGRGWTKPGGRPHAETVALEAAGPSARGATAYVTLEPCAHHGKTAPCAEALIAAHISGVVAAVEDPDPRVSGKGFALLKKAGIDVRIGICASEARALNAGFFKTVSRGRPLVTLKIAQSLDGRTAMASGESQWITGEAARRFGHLLRAQNDAIVIGIGTAQADDPLLSCRIAGLEDRSPLRVILDSRLRLDTRSKLAESSHDIATLVFTTEAAGDEALRARGVEVVRIGADQRGRPDIGAAMSELGRRGVTRVLVEGGATVQASFLEAGLVDRIELFTAPVVLGGAGRGAIDALHFSTLKEAPNFRRVGQRRLGPDLLESFEAKA